MSIDQFKEEPWKTSHSVYENSLLHMKPAPENATGEVVLASVYRRIGFEDCPERIVPKNGRDFLKRSEDSKRPRHGVDTGSGGVLTPVGWMSVLDALRSPRQPNQSKRLALQLCPIVPDVALYSSAARLVGSPWNPGELVARMVRVGTATLGEAEQVWHDLFDALSVATNDDVWARWLSVEFERRRAPEPSFQWKPRPVGSEDGLKVLAPDDYEAVTLPAKRFVRDLRTVLRLKAHLTRRQWVSLLEALLRLGTTAHVLWICMFNHKVWGAIMKALDGDNPPTADEVRKNILSMQMPEAAFWQYGKAAMAAIHDHTASYIRARAGINLVLWRSLGVKSLVVPPSALSSAQGISSFLAQVQEHHQEFDRDAILQDYARVLDREPRVAACKSGITSNIVEFVRYTLGQRQTADEALKGYDQGYSLKKKNKWVVDLGPIATMAMVTCCIEGSPAPRTVQDLGSVLGEYGIVVHPKDFDAGELGRTLRTLGLVLDSPDAEGGMVLVDPFKANGGEE